MGLDYDVACKDIRYFKETFLVPEVARCAKRAADYQEKAGKIPLPKGDPNGLLKAVDERQHLRAMATVWTSHQNAAQSILNDYNEYFAEYLKE